MRDKSKRISLESILSSPLLSINTSSASKFQQDREYLARSSLNKSYSKLNSPNNLRPYSPINHSLVLKQLSDIRESKVANSPRFKNNQISLNQYNPSSFTQISPNMNSSSQVLKFNEAIPEPLRFVVDIISGNKETTLPKFCIFNRYLNFQIGNRFAPIIARALSLNYSLIELNLRYFYKKVLL